MVVGNFVSGGFYGSDSQMACETCSATHLKSSIRSNGT